METSTRHVDIFRQLPDIGVIWVADEAARHGYTHTDPDWVNLGQGEPETGQFEGGAPRITGFTITPDDDRYGPVNGTDALRKAIADHYNRLYRQGKKSLYTAANVSIAMGGRLALTRLFSLMTSLRLGYKVPEYPAYEELLNQQEGRIIPVQVPSVKEDNYSLSAAMLAEAVHRQHLNAFLFSNPCNPTGHVVRGRELKEYLQVARERDCTLIVDEVYSHFIYSGTSPGHGPVSAAEYIRDVNEDPVIIMDGLTKSFRYPGWRLAWLLSSEKVTTQLGEAASSVDGGPSVPLQTAALQLFEPARADLDATVLRGVFSRKRNLAISRLRESGIMVSDDSTSTFYIWGDISNLPGALNQADVFFREALARKVITVPGTIFDIHPGQEGGGVAFNQHIRFSFGPPEHDLMKGIERIVAMIQSHKNA